MRFFPVGARCRVTTTTSFSNSLDHVHGVAVPIDRARTLIGDGDDLSVPSVALARNFADFVLHSALYFERELYFFLETLVFGAEIVHFRKRARSFRGRGAVVDVGRFGRARGVPLFTRVPASKVSRE